MLLWAETKAGWLVQFPPSLKRAWTSVYGFKSAYQTAAYTPNATMIAARDLPGTLFREPLHVTGEACPSAL
jgi:hypothetical protein